MTDAKPLFVRTKNRSVPRNTTLVAPESPPAKAANPEDAWDEFLRLVAEGRGLIESKAQHDVRMISQIARLFECNEARWAYFLYSKGMQRRPQAKSDFQPIVMFWIGETSDGSGRGSVCCAVLDEWARARPRVPPDEIPAWLRGRGGPDGIKRAQRAARNPGSTRDQKDVAFHRLVELGPIASFPLPPELVKFGDGDQVVLAHFDCIRGSLHIKGVVRGADQAWLRQHSEAVLASRTMPVPEPAKPSGPVDEFMTRDEVAAQLYEEMLKIVSTRPGFAKVTRWLEPAAGAGAFSKAMPPGRLALDIAPKAPDIIEHDFLTFTEFGDHIYCTAGNPPFSKGAAVKFFNHAARVSAFIGFVVPDSFANRTTKNKLDRHFHLIDTLPVSDMAFTLRGKEVLVPTLFQIWERRDELRELIPRDTPEASADLEFLPSADGATYVMQSMGENAGRSMPIGSQVSATSHWFIRCDADAIKLLNSIKWPPPKAGAVRRLGKLEIIKIYNVKKRALLSRFVH